MRTRRRRAGWLALALCFAGPARQLGARPDGDVPATDAPHPRERLFGHDYPQRVSEFLESSSRWAIVFVPNIAECTPQELEVVRALRALVTNFPELRVTTVLPEGLPESVVARGVFGEPFPGDLLQVDSEVWVREGEVAPRPRLEAWGRRGELLLMRSIPPTATAASLLEELTWARSFTSPGDSSEVPDTLKSGSRKSR